VSAETPYIARSGSEIIEALDKASARVEAAAVELGRLSQAFHESHVDDQGEIQMGVGLRFQTMIDDEKAHIYQEAIEDGKKPPPEGIREAVAQKAVQVKDPALWSEFHTTSARIKGLAAWISNQKAIISANQSIRKGEAP
jgi:hypothetical protein